MYMRVYKIPGDDKWHSLPKNGKCEITDKAEIYDVVRYCGEGHPECLPDPPKSTMCPKCFNFANEAKM